MFFNELPQISGHYLTDKGLQFFDIATGFVAAIKWWSFDLGFDLD
jgi:hypothetical protein